MNANTYEYPHAIESLSDVLDIVNRPNEYLADIIDTDDTNPHYSAPLGRHHQGAPRPFPHGMWFRGQSNFSYDLVPSVFRVNDGQGRPQFYDEREMFSDVRLRASNADLRGLNNLELMWLMQHHKLPTRLLDWTESPLVAMFFAASSSYGRMRPYTDFEAEILENGLTAAHPNAMEAKSDAVLYVLNAYRLNAVSNLSLSPDANIFQPQDIDVVLRSIMAEHTYIDSVISKLDNLDYVVYDKVGLGVRQYLHALKQQLARYPNSKRLLDELSEQEIVDGQTYFLKSFYARLSRPVAVLPKRNHPRMDAQLSCFTVHGGKLLYDDVIMNGKPIHLESKGWNFLPPPVELEPLNLQAPHFEADRNCPGQQFLKKFRISKNAVARIMIELDRFGITEAMIFQDFETQSNFAKRRWATQVMERPIFSLPSLKTCLPKKDNNNTTRYGPDKLKEIYAIEDIGELARNRIAEIDRVFERTQKVRENIRQQPKSKRKHKPDGKA